MKLILCVLVSLVHFLNGSTLHGVTLEGGSPIKFYSPGVAYTPTVLSNVIFTTNGAPYTTNYGTSLEAPCVQHLTDTVITDYRVNVFKFMTLLFKKSAALADGHFVLSPHTAWLSLAALAEGTAGTTRQALFALLNLPEDKCLRQMFYTLGATRENPSNDVILARNRLFITDSSVHVNVNWENLARTYTHLNTVSVPFKSNPFAEVEGLKRIFKAQLPNLNLNGNSFLLESLDYHGLWSSAFSDAVIEPGPFYNSIGEQIGTVEYMKTKKRVNIAYAASVDMKMIEIAVGKDERYKMIMAMTLGNEALVRSIGGIPDDLIFETLANMRPTPGPIEIVIPRLTMTSEIELRKVLDDVGIDSLWTDPAVTRNISDPAALPSSFVQRVTVTLDNSGVRPSVQEYYNFVPSVQHNTTHDSETFSMFVANRPFMFGLFDSETYTLLFAVSFSKPNA